ncbi:MAG: hypothetical protein WC365_00895 [Candidatus Babeliales bacterium]|jgi:hypothetical protein
MGASAMMARGGCAAFRMDTAPYGWSLAAPQLDSIPANISIVLNGEIHAGTDIYGLLKYNGIDAWEQIAITPNYDYVVPILVYNNAIYGSQTYMSSAYLKKWDGVNGWIDVNSIGWFEESITAGIVYNSEIYLALSVGYLVKVVNNEFVEMAPYIEYQDIIKLLFVKNNSIYAVTTKGKILFWDGIYTWVVIVSAQGSNWVNSAAEFNGTVYATINLGKQLYKWDGTSSWIEVISNPLPSGEMFSLTVCKNELYGVEGQSGALYKYDNVDSWIIVGASEYGLTNNSYSMVCLGDVLYATASSRLIKTGLTLAPTRILDASYLTLSAPDYQPWTTYPDSPVLTSLYPYQVIFSAGANIRLVVNSAPWYYNFSGDTQVKSASVGKLYQLNTGVWEYISDADNYSYTTLLQANADVYDSSSLTTVFFAKTTTDAGTLTGKRVEAAYWKDGASNRRINL